MADKKYDVNRGRAFVRPSNNARRRQHKFFNGIYVFISANNLCSFVHRSLPEYFTDVSHFMPAYVFEAAPGRAD